MNWILDNKDWLFSGAGVTLVLLAASALFKKKREEQPAIEHNTNTIIFDSAYIKEKEVNRPKSLDERKDLTRILFIDDNKFQVVKILTNSGWKNTKLIKDAKSLDDRDIVDANILFIDIQGVGLALNFKDEGLGLALAIKDKYPNKKVIIYSAETKGDRFHEALRKADASLSKNAEPYEFQKIVEEFSSDI